MYTLYCTIDYSILLTLNHKGYDMHKNVYVLLFLTMLQSSVSFGSIYKDVTPPIGLTPPVGFCATPPVGLMPPIMEDGNFTTPPIG